MAKNVTRDTERLQMMQSNNKELSSAVSRIQSNNKELESTASALESRNRELSSAVSRMQSQISRLKRKKIHGNLIDLLAPAPMGMDAADLIKAAPSH